MSDVDQVVDRVKAALPEVLIKLLPDRVGFMMPTTTGMVHLKSVGGSAPFVVTTTSAGADQGCATIERAAETAIARIRELPKRGEGAGPMNKPPKPPKPLAQIFAIEDPHEFRDALTYSLVYRGAEALNPVERAIWAIWWLEAEANNGSFDQYFNNSTGDDAADALRGLSLIGAVRCAELLRKAMAIFPGGAPSPDRGTRWKQIQALGEAAARTWDPLSDEFTDYPEDLNRLVRDYCLAHRGDFGA